MTVECAVQMLREYQRKVAYMPHRAMLKYLRKGEFTKISLENQLVDYLIERIRRERDKDPRCVIREYYNELDDIHCKSESRITWTFCSIMENGTHDILNYMADKERRSR